MVFLVLLWRCIKPELWPRVALSLFNLIFFFCMYHNAYHWLLLAKRKLPLAHWFSLEIHIGRRVQVIPIYLMFETKGAMDRTLGQPKVKLSIVLRPLNTWYLTGWICAWAGWSVLPAPGAEVSLSACSSARPGAVKSMKISSRDQLTTSAVALFWARICKRLISIGIDSKVSIPPAYIAWWAGTSNRVAVPARQAGNRFLGSLKGLQIRALYVHVIFSSGKDEGNACWTVNLTCNHQCAYMYLNV